MTATPEVVVECTKLATEAPAERSISGSAAEAPTGLSLFGSASEALSRLSLSGSAAEALVGLSLSGSAAEAPVGISISGSAAEAPAGLSPVGSIGRSRLQQLMPDLKTKLRFPTCSAMYVVWLPKHLKKYRNGYICIKF
jgi:hypothetical protein